VLGQCMEAEYKELLTEMGQIMAAVYMEMLTVWVSVWKHFIWNCSQCSVILWQLYMRKC